MKHSARTSPQIIITGPGHPASWLDYPFQNQGTACFLAGQANGAVFQIRQCHAHHGPAVRSCIEHVFGEGEGLAQLRQIASVIHPELLGLVAKPYFLAQAYVTS